MSTPHPRRGAAKQTALSVIVALLCVMYAAAGSASAAQPVARTASARAVARISRTELHRVLVERADAQRAARRDTRALHHCRRTRRGHCARARRTLRRARNHLVRLEREANRLRARLASVTAPDGSGAADRTSTGFGEPFVKGIDTNLQGWGVEALPKIAGEMGSLGVNWAREDLSWADSEPQPGVFDWSSFDRIVYAAQARGITILPIVGYAPSWSNPSDAAAYAAFVKVAVERYGPGTRANLPWWELWNEPYFSYAWDHKTAEPQAYARDVLAAAQAAKGVAPSVKLLAAADYEDEQQIGSSQWETAWVDDMFSAVPSLGSWIDGVSVHPYGDDPALGLAKSGGWRDAEGGWSFQRIDTIRARFLAHGVNVPFWITEVGQSTTQVSESAQAAYYADLIPQIAQRPWVRALFPYCLREFEASGGKESQFGLLRYGSWEPKPAFYALQKGLSSLS